MELVSKNRFYIGDDAGECRGVGGGLEGLQKGLTLAGRDVELTWRGVSDVGLYDVLDFLSEWLNGN